MRYGILSDIHGNLPALDAVLDHLAAAAIDRFLILGDVVGYGADPNACCERVRALPGLRVHGNHDLAALSTFDLEWFSDRARQAAEWTARELDPESRAFLRALPAMAGDDGLQLAHGSLTAPATDYITNTWEAAACLDLQGEPVCFVGHTHVPAVFARPEGTRLCGELPFRSRSPLQMERGTQYVVNCGAVGQPRDGNPHAACGIYDTGTRTVMLARVPYDIATAQRSIRAAGLPCLLADRLAMGA